MKCAFSLAQQNPLQHQCSQRKSGEKNKTRNVQHIATRISLRGILQTQLENFPSSTSDTHFPSFTQKRKKKVVKMGSHMKCSTFSLLLTAEPEIGGNLEQEEGDLQFSLSHRRDIAPSHAFADAYVKILSSHFSPNLFGPNSDISLQVTIFLLFSMGCSRIGCFYVGLFRGFFFFFYSYYTPFFSLEAAKGL